MKGDELLFELRGPDGHVWRLYLDGRTDGFPAGTAIENRAAPLWCALVGASRNQTAIDVGGGLAQQESDKLKLFEEGVSRYQQRVRRG